MTHHAPSNLPAQEMIPAGEAQYVADLTQRLKAKIIQDNGTGLMRRDAHPKMHGLVKAQFTIESDLPQDLRVGVFSQPKTYDAWIRFSNQNGTMQSDTKRDIRGMAIKLMGVGGEKLLPAEKDAQTHDFIVISTPKFVTKDVQEFDALIKAFTANVFAILWFLLTHLRVGWNLLQSMLPFANPLQIRYFSTTPYLWGSDGKMAVKYCATPHVTIPDAIPPNAPDDFLRQAMIKQLATGDAVFDFCVQLQTSPAVMPIEDPGKAWSEVLSPFRKVATIRIPQQSFDTPEQNTFGENLSFTPWHALPDHRPLGGINRARRVVYDAISSFRHQVNHAARVEPTSWNQ